MASYLVGERIHIDAPDEPDGIPIIDEFGVEVCISPEQFDYLGRPEADAMSVHFDPEPTPQDYLAAALDSFKPGNCSAYEVAASAMIWAGVHPPTPNPELLAVAQDLIDKDIQGGEA